MSRTKHYCQSNYKATEYCQSGHIELTWVSRERKLSTSHCLKQLIRLVPRTAVVATLGIVTAGKWSSVLTFPSFLLGLCDAAGSKSAYNLFRNWWISLVCCSLIFRILSSRCFCSISKSSELASVRTRLTSVSFSRIWVSRNSNTESTVSFVVFSDKIF